MITCVTQVPSSTSAALLQLAGWRTSARVASRNVTILPYTATVRHGGGFLGSRHSHAGTETRLSVQTILRTSVGIHPYTAQGAKSHSQSCRRYTKRGNRRYLSNDSPGEVGSSYRRVWNRSSRSFFSDVSWGQAPVLRAFFEMQHFF